MEYKRIGYLCIQRHPHRICLGCTSACNEPVFVQDPTHNERIAP